MQGFPPPDAKRLAWKRADHMRFPTHRFAFSHMREFLPTVRVSRGYGAVWNLPVALRDDLDAVRFRALDDDRELSWEAALAVNFTDAVLVLHRGAVVYERYLGVTRRDTPHIAFSVTKSFVGTLAEMLIAEGRLDPAAPIAELIPELARSGFAISAVCDSNAEAAQAAGYADPSWQPLDLLILLFGLAMDYQMFLVSGMREGVSHGEDARTAVKTGFMHGAKVVTAAAIIMFSVFGGFVFSHLTMVRPMGFGLAVGVLVDAVLVRMTLTPALMHLLGDRAWWMPAWLDRLTPNLDVEGTGLAAHLDAERAGRGEEPRPAGTDGAEEGSRELSTTSA